MPYKFIPVSNGWDGVTTELVEVSDEWEVCEYYCSWVDESESDRGEKNKPGHEHRKDRGLVSGWGFDAWGLSVDDDDKKFIEDALNFYEAHLKASTRNKTSS